MAAAHDEMKGDSDYSLLLDALKSNQIEGAISPEDVAWADSCLSKDVDSTDTDWSSVQDALLEFLSSQPGVLDSAVAESNGQLDDDEILHSRGNVESLEFSRGSDEDEDIIDDDIGEIESMGSSKDYEDDLMLANRKPRARGKSRVKSIFQPHYTEDIVKVENLDSGSDPSLTTVELEPSSEDLFKVWDLEIPDEEDDFTAQLNKALSEDPPPIEPTVDDSTSWKDLVDVSVDDLIAGLGDLLLEQDTK